jgi:hypothetical protein
MSIYFLPYLAFAFVAALGTFIRRRDMWVLTLPLVLACALMAGIRFETDNDWATYLGIFQDIPPLTDGIGAWLKATDDLYLEPVFALLVSIIKIAFPDVAVFLVMSVASLLIYYQAFRKVAKYPALAFLIYMGDGFYLREFTQIRFGLSVALGFAGICALYLGKSRRFWWLSLWATAFHYTGVVLFATKLWLRFVSTRRRILLISTAMFVLALAGVFGGFVEALDALGLAPARLTAYLDTEDAAGVAQLILIGQFVILVMCAWRVDQRDPGYFWVSIYALSFAILCLFSGFDLMRRMSFFFTTALYVLASIAMQRRKYMLLMLLVAYSAALFAARLTILQDYATIFG